MPVYLRLPPGRGAIYILNNQPLNRYLSPPDRPCIAFDLKGGNPWGISKLGYPTFGMSLTELGIKAAKAQDKPYKL